MSKQTYTKEEFISAYHNNSTKTDLLLELGLSPKSSHVVDKRCKEYELSLSKFKFRSTYSCTDKQFREIVARSFSKRQALLAMNLAAKGGNYKTFDNRCKKLNIDTSHFTGQLWNKGKKIGPKRKIQDYLDNKCQITSSKLRERLIKENYFKHECTKCGNSEWNELPIPLELDHKDGNHFNNSLDNLDILCPNCHAQTSNYRGKNIGAYK